VSQSWGDRGGDVDRRFKDVLVDGVIHRVPVADTYAQPADADPVFDEHREPIRLLPSHLEWTGEWLHVRAAGGGTRTNVTGDLYTIAWPSVVRLAAVDPWPRFTLGWRQGGYRMDELFDAWPGHDERFEARARELAEEAGRRAPRLVERGWMDALDIEWQRVPSLPDDAARTQGQGVFRTSARERAPEPVLARSARRSATEALLTWLASGPERPWKEQPVELVMTFEHLYVRAPAGIRRIPLTALRVLMKGKGRDALAIFGKRTRLLLVARPGCPVLAELERVLADRGRAP